MKKIILLFAGISLLAACQNEKKTDKNDGKETTMSAIDNKEERNKKVIMASLQSFEKGDVDGVLKDAAPAFVDYFDGSVPPISNLDTLRNLLKEIWGSLEGYRPGNTMYFVDGDYVIVYADWTAVFKKDLMGIKATGKPVAFKDVDIFKLNEDGKITEHRSIQNTGAVLMCSGMMK